MEKFGTIKTKVEKTGILSLDLETTSLVPADSELELIALASGIGRNIEALAVKPSDDILGFVVECLTNPDIRVVGHNIISFDSEVLHHLGIIRLRDIKAKLVDTLPMSWLLNENINHKLKFLAKKYMGVDMVEYEEAYLESPSLKKIRALDGIIKENNDKIEGYQKKLTRLTNPGLRAEAKAQITVLTQAIEDMKSDQLVLRLTAEKEQRAYAADDARQTLRLYYRFRKSIIEKGWAKWMTVELKARRAAAAMELSGIRIDLDKLNALRPQFDALAELFHNRVRNLAKEDINPRSNKDLARVLYHTLGIPPVKMREDDPGDEKTGEAILTRINHPLAQAILDFRVVDKLKGTYLDAIWQKVKDREDSRLYGRLNTTGTRTGRFSSSKPNLQNIPSRKKPSNYDERVQNIGPKLREAFVGPPGKKLIVIDLSQIELRLIAHVTQDEKMLSIYNQYTIEDGIKFYTGDIHAETMANAKVDRKLSKNMNFGMVYGITALGFCRRFKIFKPGTKEYDVERVQNLMDSFFEIYSGIARTTQVIRKMWDGGFGQYPKRQFKMLSGRLRRFKETDKHSPGAILNAIIQGSAADFFKAGIVAINEQMLAAEKFKDVKLLLQVHDEVLLEAPEEQANEVGIVAKYALERPWFDLTVPILASAKVCDKWSEKDDDSVPEVGVMPKSKGIKAATAILTEEQEKFAAQFITEVTCYSSSQLEKDVLTVEEYERIK